jgi:hypothetical protein
MESYSEKDWQIADVSPLLSCVLYAIILSHDEYVYRENGAIHLLADLYQMTVVHPRRFLNMATLSRSPA